MFCYVLFVFSILVSITGGETAAYKPKDVILVNCGATTETIDTSNRTWAPEQQNVFSSNLASASFSSNASQEDPSVPLVPYKTARIFRSKFTYSFSVSPGWTFLRLYFYPTRYGSNLNAVNSFFYVTINGFTLLRNFSADLTSNPFLIKEFIVPILDGHNNKLNLTLTPFPHSLAFLNGVEIVSMPDGFYTKGGSNGYIRNVGSTSDFEVNGTTLLETLYRLNVGGKMVAAVDDTGMFRQWLPDDDFILQEVHSGTVGVSLNVPGVKINFTNKTPAYVASEDVYTTFRSMGNPHHPGLNLLTNMTWLFDVDAGFNYLVRLHFCETLQKVTKPSQRVFSIFIGNQIAKPETDVIYLSGGPRIPVYLDFHTFLDGERPNLRLDLNPYKDDTLYYDVLLNGIEILKLIDSKSNLPGPNPNPITLGGGKLHGNPNPTMLGGKLHVLVIILIAVGSATVLATFIAVFMFSKRQMKKKNRKDNSNVMFKVLLQHYTNAELKKITKSFSHTVGKGGFGTVYAGNLLNGRKVAVKVLKDSEENGEDFINEVASMSQTSHVNIVSLLGFCYEGSKRAIVYEFLENGSLDQFISKESSLNLDVTILYGIALGVARGLEYLHYGCKTRIVHFDIKPQNILLDDNLCPKVSDFGLAKLCEKRESIVSLIDTRGTIGYIAPEVFSRMYGGVSHKSDVYSYGMLVLEMIGARNKENAASNASSSYFPDWIYEDLDNGEKTWRFGDEITREDEEIAKKMILVGLWCTQPWPLDRPPMNRVVEMMEGSLDALKVPPKPSIRTSAGESSSLSYGETSKSSDLHSANSLFG